jgi:hypothetical protein
VKNTVSPAFNEISKTFLPALVDTKSYAPVLMATQLDENRACALRARPIAARAMQAVTPSRRNLTRIIGPSDTVTNQSLNVFASRAHAPHL